MSLWLSWWQEKNRRGRITVWVREWVKNRETYGVYQHLLQELRLGDAATCRNFMWMDCTTFQFLLNLVGPKITFRDTHLRRAIIAGERLALTLRFLATGNYNQYKLTNWSRYIFLMQVEHSQVCSTCTGYLTKLLVWLYGKHAQHLLRCWLLIIWRCACMCVHVCVCDDNDSGESGGYDNNDDNKDF